MRPHTYIITFMLVLLSIPQIVSAQTTQEQLIGTWTFDYQASINNMGQKSKAHYNKMETSRQSKLSARYKGRKVIFNNDGTYVQIMTDGRSTSAIWTINRNNKLKITTPNGKIILFEIKKLGRGKAILSQVNTKGGALKILFSNWYLTKN